MSQCPLLNFSFCSRPFLSFCVQSTSTYCTIYSLINYFRRGKKRYRNIFVARFVWPIVIEECRCKFYEPLLFRSIARQQLQSGVRKYGKKVARAKKYDLCINFGGCRLFCTIERRLRYRVNYIKVFAAPLSQIC